MVVARANAKRYSNFRSQNPPFQASISTLKRWKNMLKRSCGAYWQLVSPSIFLVVTVVTILPGDRIHMNHFFRAGTVPKPLVKVLAVPSMVLLKALGADWVATCGNSTTHPSPKNHMLWSETWTCHQKNQKHGKAQLKLAGFFSAFHGKSWIPCRTPVYTGSCFPTISNKRNQRKTRSIYPKLITIS